MSEAATVSVAKPSSEKRRCQHCGNSFLPRFSEENFCCSGCRIVHELIASGGFNSFYELLGQRVLEPASNREPSADLLTEIGEAVTQAEAISTSNSPARLTLRIGNLSCTACIWLIDRLFQQQEGAIKMNSNTARSTLTLWWHPGQFDLIQFVRDLHQYGYPAGLVDPDEEGPADESRALLTRLGVTCGLALNTMAFTLPSYLGMETDDQLARLFTLVAFGSATLALAVGGSYFFHRAWSALRLGALHMDVPISLGLIAAYLGSLAGLIAGIEGMLYFDFVATFTFLMLGGRWLHLRLLERNRRQLWARERDLTSVFKIDETGSKIRTPLRKILSGDHLEVPPESLLPVESVLIEERARLHLDWINGEPDAITFVKGQRIRAGARNAESHPIRVISEQPFAASFLDRLLDPSRMAEDDEAQSKNPVLKIYLIIVLLIALIGGLCWILGGRGISASLQVFISVLIVSCPCALGLALPLLDEMLLSKLRREGIFIRRHSLWVRLRSIRTLAFDKTGTLTEPVKRLANSSQLNDLDPDEREALQLLTQHNQHPVGRALHDILTAHFGTTSLSPTNLTDEPGSGVSCEHTDSTWKLGRDDWAVDTETASTGCTLSRDGKRIATFQLEESIRDGAVDQISQLKNVGFQIQILSGDPNSSRVAETATKLGITPENVHADMTPQAKADFIGDQAADSTLFVGDGGNDGLALDAAAASGSPATGIRAVESRADFVFTGRGFHAISRLFESAARRRKIVIAVFTTAILYNIFAIGLCLAGMMNPLLAAVLMPLSSIVTTAIAARV
tara:strand:- start:1923 stop:4310 length:2388 start_codon:yes stop_codon:yes gene_type:complete